MSYTLDNMSRRIANLEGKIERLIGERHADNMHTSDRLTQQHKTLIGQLAVLRDEIEERFEEAKPELATMVFKPGVYQMPEVSRDTLMEEMVSDGTEDILEIECLDGQMHAMPSKVIDARNPKVDVDYENDVALLLSPGQLQALRSLIGYVNVTYGRRGRSVLQHVYDAVEKSGLTRMVHRNTEYSNVYHLVLVWTEDDE